MEIGRVIEKNLTPVDVDSTLGDLVKVITKSKRNIFPVIDKQFHLMGIIMLDDVREVMFQKEKYNELFVKDLMTLPSEHVNLSDNMETVMEKFKTSGLWNLPVIEDSRYIGFVSRANVFNEYRKKLMEFTEEL
jgi:CIC family chloride channel protein